MSLSSGSRLGPYEIVAPLGAGGMGEVYRAKDPRLGREVAVKVLPASFSNDPDRLRRFEQEARAAGLLNHPNITAVFDIGSHDGAPYVVSELLEGETLRAELAGDRLAPRKAIDYAIQLAHGLAAAHEKGIVHRDLKPENVFVTRNGRVKILDCGLAKQTHAEDGSWRDSPLPRRRLGQFHGFGRIAFSSRRRRSFWSRRRFTVRISSDGAPGERSQSRLGRSRRFRSLSRRSSTPDLLLTARRSSTAPRARETRRRSSRSVPTFRAENPWGSPEFNSFLCRHVASWRS